jgi:hypothetical protein
MDVEVPTTPSDLVIGNRIRQFIPPAEVACRSQEAISSPKGKEYSH